MKSIQSDTTKRSPAGQSRREFLKRAGKVAAAVCLPLPPGAWADDAAAPSDIRVEDRPAYHISSPTIGWPFDPNGAIHWKGRYHLMWIQKNPGRGWAHASSADLIHWRMHPRQDEFYFSGNAFTNLNGRPTIVFGGKSHPAISVAVAEDDDLDWWTVLPSKKGHEPGDPAPNRFDIWDPCGWHDGERCYAIFGSHPWRQQPPTIWRSDDLKKWNYVGPLLEKRFSGVDVYEDVSCPDLFKLGDKHVLMCISHVKGARYYMGTVQDGRFVPEWHERLNWPGGARFATESLLDGSGRRIMWAWAMDVHEYRDRQTSNGWAGVLTMPTVVSLGDDGTLRFRPVEEYEQLRENPRECRQLEVPAGRDLVLSEMCGDCMELEVRAEPASDQPFGVKVRHSPGGEESTAILYDPGKRVIRIDLARSSLDKKVVYHRYVQNYGGRNDTPKQNPLVQAQEAPFELPNSEPLTLRIFIDRSILEVFVNNRLCLVQRVFPTRTDSVGIALFSADGKTTFPSVKAWQMSPIKIAPLEK